jgi:hypothetical protein
VNTPQPCAFLELVSGVPVLANLAGTNVVQTRALVKIRTLAESGTCRQAPRDPREIYPSATVCYCTENERTPGGKAKRSGLAGGLDRAGIAVQVGLMGVERQNFRRHEVKWIRHNAVEIRLHQTLAHEIVKRNDRVVVEHLPL